MGAGETVGVEMDRYTFLVNLYNRRAMELLIARNGSFFAGGHPVKLTHHEAKLGLDEGIKHAEDELRCQGKS